MADFVAGEDLSADELNVAQLAGTLVARGRRTTSSTASASEQSVLRIDNVPVVSGRVYYITTNPLLVDTSVANDIGRVNLRIDETGAAATTASTQITSGQQRLEDATNGRQVMAGTSRSASATGLWSILMSTSRVSGSGNISLVGASTLPIELFVYDCGEDPGDTGVDL